MIVNLALLYYYTTNVLLLYYYTFLIATKAVMLQSWFEIWRVQENGVQIETLRGKFKQPWTRRQIKSSVCHPCIPSKLSSWNCLATKGGEQNRVICIACSHMNTWRYYLNTTLKSSAGYSEDQREPWESSGSTNYPNHEPRGTPERFWAFEN